MQSALVYKTTFVLSNYSISIENPPVISAGCIFSLAALNCYMLL